MGRAPCCDKANVKKGPWSPEEDAKLKEYIEKYGTGGNWIALPQKAGLRRCGKSCRLRWLNYLRPNIRHGEFSEEEDRIICSLYATIGSRWSIIAAQLPDRTDNDIKNYWNTRLKKKLLELVPSPQKRSSQATTTTTYPPFSFLQNSSVSSPYSSPPTASTYTCLSNNYCSTTTTSFTGYENMASPPSLLINTASLSNASSAPPTMLQAQDGSVGPMQNCAGMKDSMLSFGGDQASCSSTGRSSTNQISHGKQHEYDHRENLDLQGCGGEKFMVNTSNNDGNGYAADDQKPNGCYGTENPLDYTSLEEIKQLISTNICNNLSLFLDENKTEEKVLYY